MRESERLALYLRQREELGAGTMFLEGMTREQVLDLAGETTRDAGADLPQSAASAGLPRRPTPPAPSTGSAESARDVTMTELATLDYDALRSAAAECTRCALAEGRNSVVFSDGNPAARLMVVGEAPGANEDRTGVPFVGQAGKLLDLILASVDLSRRETVYICNVLKCRPPANRNPLPDEIDACSGFLSRQIKLVAPEVILATGTFAAQWLTGQQIPLGKLRGQVYSYEGVPLLVTYHPAALLRNSGWSRAVWDDMQLLRRIMDEA